MIEFEPWQQRIIDQVRRSMPGLPGRLVVHRAQLPDGALGHSFKRADGSNVVLLDPPQDLSIGAFRYLVAHECQHIRQGHPGLIERIKRLAGATDEELAALEAYFELAADRALERAGYGEDMRAFVRCYPADRLADRSWEGVVLRQYGEVEPKITAALEARMHQ